MHRRFAIIALALFCVCCSEPASRVREISAETVALVIRDSDGDVMPFCSGVWVGAHRIVTAAHCVLRMAETQELGDPLDTTISYIVQNEVTGHFTEPRAWHAAKPLAIDEKHDVALLDAPNPPSHETAALAYAIPEPGEAVHCVGQDRGFYWTYIHGYMSGVWAAMSGQEHEGPWMQVTAPVSLGMSGSGTFDDTGRLVGILSFVSSAPDVAFYIHLDTLRGFINVSR